MKKFIFGVLFILACALVVVPVANAQDADVEEDMFPKIPRISNKKWNITAGVGTYLMPIKVYAKDATTEAKSDKELTSEAVSSITGQIYFNDYVGISLGQQTAGFGYKKGETSPYIMNFEMTSLSTVVLLRYPVADFMDVYAGLGLSFMTATIDQFGVDSSDIVSQSSNISFMLPQAEFGLRFYVNHFTFGLKVSGLPLEIKTPLPDGTLSVIDATTPANYKEPELGIMPIILEINAGFAF
ncbi:hypothetical protein RsTz2092_09830 [Deferribacterales bacterium RsTz2092]|nr:hypothetical protein AGMMS49941_03290 [Deferribacterales bacterium]